jgi:hypothetical protein
MQIHSAKLAFSSVKVYLLTGNSYSWHDFWSCLSMNDICGLWIYLSYFGVLSLFLFVGDNRQFVQHIGSFACSAGI